MSTNNLMVDYIGLVRAMAWKIHQQLPRNVELDDLVGYGCVGLAEAAQSYTPDGGVKFSTFAYHRVRGAILDGLSQMNWFKRDKFAANEYRKQTGEADGTESENTSYASEEGAGESSLGYTRWNRDASERLTRQRVPLEDDPADHSASANVEAGVMQREIEIRVKQLVNALPEAAAELLKATYYEGLSLKDAAARVGRDKSWASRLHARTLAHLAQELKAEGYG